MGHEPQNVPQAVQIVQSRGVDQRVDYAELTRLGPWDDRNYRLTREDLAVLPPDEERYREALPAWYRVEVRRAMAQALGVEPPVSRPYPRSALPTYLQRYGGYLIDGRITRNVSFVRGRFVVRLEQRDGDTTATRFLHGDTRMTSPNGAAESAVAISPVDPRHLVSGTNGPGGGQKMHYSHDGGETWNAAGALPTPSGQSTCCDPTVDWSQNGLFAYTATLGNCGSNGCDIWFMRSDDQGESWTGLSGDGVRVLSETSQRNDKEYIHVDGHSGSPCVDNVYATWHDFNDMRFARSTDFGESWSAPLDHSAGSGELGIGSDITSDSEGHVYHFWPAFNSQTILVKKSTDCGAGFGATTTVASTQGSFIFPVPSMETRQVFIYVSADTDLTGGAYHDSVYAAWTDSTAATTSTPSDNHARIQVAYSRDGGGTWNVVTPHSTADMDSVDRYHPWLAVAPDGIVHLIFYDTTRDPSRQSVDVFHTFSVDGARTFSTPERITSAQSPNPTDGFEFGDYNGLSAVGTSLMATWTDNRDETGGDSLSIDVYAYGLTRRLKTFISEVRLEGALERIVNVGLRRLGLPAVGSE